MFRFVASVALLSLALGVSARATCNPPASAGAVICYPSTNSTFTGAPKIEAAATGETGAIHKMVLYVDNVKEYEVDNSNTMNAQVYTGPIDYNGYHHFVLNAWDLNGKLFQYSMYAMEIDGNVPVCAAPSSGFNICSPTANSYQNFNMPVVISGASNITGYKVYFNGVYSFSSTGRNLTAYSSIQVTANWNTMKVVASASNGTTYTKSVQFKLYYSAPACGRNGCGPGITIQSPGNYEDVTSPFVISAKTSGANPITTMKVYVDNTLVNTTYGSSVYLHQKASQGTHLVTVQAWDTKGILYKLQETVNVE